MRGVTLLRVRPAERTVTTVTRPSISMDLIAQLIGTKDLRACELGAVNLQRPPDTEGFEFPICAVHRRWDFQYGLKLPRWRLRGMPIVFGETILFGLNEKGKAAECPITSMQAFDLTEWLEPITAGGIG